jgi:hypothetical protein
MHFCRHQCPLYVKIIIALGPIQCDFFINAGLISFTSGRCGVVVVVTCQNLDVEFSHGYCIAKEIGWDIRQTQQP